MCLKTYHFLALFLLFCIQYNFVIIKALVGQNVRQANEGEFPFVVSISRIDVENPQEEDNHICTGSVLSVKDIATTSLGMEEICKERFEIRIGSIDLRVGRKFNPAWWINYMQWITSNNLTDPYENNDIAVIRLTEAIPDGIIPAILLPLSHNALYGQNVTIAGWGEAAGGHPSRFLNTAILNVMTKRNCERRQGRLIRRNVLVPYNVICSVAQPYILSSPGDSGAPVLYMGLIVAIHIGAAPSNDRVGEMHPTRVNYHTSITKFVTFITEIFELG